MPRIALEVHMNPFEHLHIYATVFSVGCVGGVERVTYFVPPAACYVLQAMGTNCASGKAMPLTSLGGITNTPNSGECYDWFVSQGIGGNVYMSDWGTSRPTGCWKHAGAQAYFNIGSPGVACGSCAPVCKCEMCTKDRDSPKCAAGTELSEQQCIDYASDTEGKTFTSSFASTDYPSGCWAYALSAGQVYYNPTDHGGTSNNAGPICTRASGNPTCVARVFFP